MIAGNDRDNTGACPLYTTDAAEEEDRVDNGGGRHLKHKQNKKQ